VETGTGNVTDWGLTLGAAANSELFAVQATADDVYVGGTGTINDGTTTRTNLAKIGAATSATIAANWNPNPNGIVHALQISPDTSTLFLAGKFTAPHLSASEVRLSDGSITGWRPQASIFSFTTASTVSTASTVFDLETTDLTNGGAETRWSTVLTGNFNTTKTFYNRTHSAEVFRYGAPGGDGWPGDWDPESDLFGQRYDAAVSGDVLAVGGNFTAYGLDVVRRDLAFFRDPAPETTITGHIGEQVTSRHTQIFSYSSDSGTAFECSLSAPGEPASYHPCGIGPQGTNSYPGLPTGRHVFRVRAKDGRETVGAEAVYEWTIQDYASAPQTDWPQVGEGTEIRAVIPDGIEGPDGNEGWYVGGDFTTLCDAGEVGEECGAHNNIAHIRSDGTVNDPWNPTIDDPGTGTPVRALALNESTNTLYVGGSFSSVNGGAIAISRLASIDTNTGGFLGWDPNVTGGWVYSLELNADTDPNTIDTIYAGGTFGSAGNQPRPRLAEISLADANATTWDTDVVSGQILTIALGSTKLYAGGIGGVGGLAGTGNLVAIDRVTGDASNTWRPMPNNTVNKIALRSPDSSTLHVGGSFTSIGSAARSKAAEIDITLDAMGNLGSGTATAWAPQPTGATHAFAFVHGTVLIGGAFQTLVLPPPQPSLTRLRLAQTHGSTGAPLEWSPSVDSTAVTMANQGSVLAVGGLFQNASDAPRKLLAFYGPPD
jgi:hypothetical protein